LKTYLLKLDDAMYADWQARVKAAKMKMAEWIRMMCNGASPERHEDVEDRTSEDAARTPRISLEKRRTAPRGGRERRTARRHGGTLGAVEDVAHESIRRTFSDSAAASTGDVVVKHTAESNWHSCLCPHCTARRKTLGLEIGEIPTKREKKFGKK